MKKITLFVALMSNLLLFGQQYQIEIRLVDANIGYPEGDPLGNYPAYSNDIGLNDIFIAFEATNYYPGWDQTYIPEWIDRTHFVLCDGCDINAFEQALIDYSGVVENTIQCQPGLINALYVRLITLDNGTNTGTTTSGGVVITDDDDLNIIFENFDVLYYEPAFPSSQNEQLLRTYVAACDCDASQLLPILEAEVQTIELVEGPLGLAILANEDFKKLNFQFYPNPVNDKVFIQTTEEVRTLEVFNMLGQVVYKAVSVEQFKAYIPSINTGSYVLRVETVDGAIEAYKFLKM